MGLFSKKNNSSTSASDGSSHLKITVTKDGGEYTFLLDGKLDTLTSPALDKKINEVIEDADKLVMDLSGLVYISSAGLRVLLGALQLMEDKGEMVVCNITEPVRQVFDLTGFSRLFSL